MLLGQSKIGVSFGRHSLPREHEPAGINFGALRIGALVRARCYTTIPSGRTRVSVAKVDRPLKVTPGIWYCNLPLGLLTRRFPLKWRAMCTGELIHFAVSLGWSCQALSITCPWIGIRIGEAQRHDVDVASKYPHLFDPRPLGWFLPHVQCMESAMRGKPTYAAQLRCSNLLILLGFPNRSSYRVHDALVLLS